jgi:putative ABC transport system substrate-binding protein
MATRSKQHRGLHLKIQSLVVLCLSLLALLSPLSLNAEPPILVAITQIVEHPSLAEAKRGLIDVLVENGYVPNKNIKIVEENAQGNLSLSAQIAKKLVSQKPKAIVAISTPSAQSVLKAAKENDIPVVFSSVTDPVAAGLVKDTIQPQPNITGAIDFPPLDEEWALIKALVPNVKTVAVIYNPGEANSVKTLVHLKQTAGKDIVIIEAPIMDSQQAGPTMQKLIGKVDAIYLPSDNTVFSALPVLIKLSQQHQVPLFSSDPDAVKLGVLGCVGYSQYEVGRAAGKLLVNILKGNPPEKITRPENYDIVINQTTAEKLNITVPKELLGKKIKIVSKDKGQP